jgi:hypothetical protein
MAEAKPISSREFIAPHSPVPENQDVAQLKKLCSRLAGEALCRCGGNLNGRYCLWSYYRIQPGLAGPETMPAEVKQ